MSWAENLLNTYEACEEIVGIPDNDGNALLPVGYTLLKINVTITLDGDGNFISAEKLDIPEYISIPCTEESAASRTSGIYPHPLFDQLKYIAGDYDTYSGKQYAKHFDQYIKGLQAWCMTPYCHPKIESVYMYVIKKMVIQDLKKTQLYTDDDLKKTKKADGKIKFVMADYGVRFKVRVSGDFEDRLWLDKSVQEKYLGYLISQQTDQGICYLTGERAAISDKYPKGINNKTYGAKLISANEKSNGRIIYSGKFSDLIPSVTLSFDALQKLHQALRWLIATRGTLCDTQAVVAWAIDKRIHVEDPFEDSFGIYQNKIKTDADRLREAGAVTDLDYGLALRTILYGTGNANRLKEHTRRIVILAVDAATTGRLSVTYHRELPEDEYHEKIANWHEQCRWYQLFKNSQNEVWENNCFIGAPSVKRISKAVLGKKPAKGSESYDKLEKGIRERLLHCIMDGEKIPKDMLNTMLYRASNPLGMENKDSKSAVLRWRDWEEVLGVTCGLWKKYYYEKGDEFQLSLEENRTNRDYLYGRLLAVADRIESSARYKQGNAKDDARATNAVRYMTVFSQHPFRTWKTLWEQLNPYIQQLDGANWYMNQIGNIMANFREGEFESDRPLDGSYLMGYFLQRQALKLNSKSINGGNKNESDE